MESRAIHPGMRRDDAVRLVAQERRKARPPIKAPNGYVASPEFRSATEDNIWYRGELEKLSSVNCKQLVPEDGMTGVRADTARRNSSTWYSGKYSVFSGALAEAILLRYGGEEPKRVLDPFAGGARRGVVTEKMGHEYHGVDISKTIIEENRAICAGLGYHPHYYEGDAATLDCVQGKYGFMFTCPPYWNVETYSGHKNCFANAKKYEAFRGLLGDFARASRSKLEPGALACIVVADISWNGTLYDFPGHTMAAFAAAGFSCLNRIILIDAMGSGHKRKDRLWDTAQKLVRRDQQILVFKVPNVEQN